MRKHTDTEFDKVYQRSYTRVFNFARRLCGNQEHAEDVTQETFIRAYNAFDNMRRADGVEHWLMKIAHNVFIDLKRREKRRVVTQSESSMSEENMLDLVADTKLNVEQLLMRATLDPHVERTLASLDPQSMELIVMAFVEELPHSEIASRLGIRMGKVRSLIHRTCSQLQRSLALHDARGPCLNP